MFNEQIVFAESEYRREQAKNSWPARQAWPTRFIREPRRRRFFTRTGATSKHASPTDQTTAA